MTAPGMCADGSGAWLPLFYPDGSFDAVCPSDPRYAELERRSALGQSTQTGNVTRLALGFFLIFAAMGAAYYIGGRKKA